MDRGFHAKPGLFFNIFGVDLYFDTLIFELFQICLVISQTQKVHFKRCLLVCQGRGGG